MALVPFRNLPQDRQPALRAAWPADMARPAATVFDDRSGRLAAWFAPLGPSFTAEVLPRRRPGA